MKKPLSNGWIALICSLFVLMSFSLCAQSEDEVPRNVQTTFETMYPDAEEPFWQNEGNEYKATFYEDVSIYEAFFSDNGTWTMTMTDIEIDALPELAAEYVYKLLDNEPDFMVGVVKTTAPETVKYQVNFESETKEIILKFDASGTLLNKEKKNL